MDLYGVNYDDDEVLTFDDLIKGDCYNVDFPVYEFVPPSKVMAIEVSAAFSQSIATKVVGFCSVLNPVPSDDDKNFRLFRISIHAQTKNFLNGHPLAKLPLNVPLKLRNAYDDKYEAIALSIDVNDGSILFDRQVNSVNLMMDEYCVDKSDRFLAGVLSEYGAIVRNGGPRAIELDLFFEQKLEVKPSLNFDDTPYVLVQGVAGSGKSTKLVEDVQRRRTGFDLVVAPTNASVLSLAEKLSKAGVPCVHYTNDHESDYDYKKIFKNSNTYKDYLAFRTKPRKTKEENQQWKNIKYEMLKALFACVVLVTPVMARSIISTFNIRKNDSLSIYVDEAGIIKVVDALPIMLTNRKSIWFYGDYKQNKPFVSEEGLDFDQKVQTRLNRLLTFGLSEWMSTMQIPMVTLDVCKRLPETQAVPFVDFFYKDRQEDGTSYKKVFDREILMSRFTKTIYPKIPDSLRDYPYMRDQDKEKEANYLWGTLRSLKPECIVDSTVFICTHNYICASVNEILKILVPNKKFNIVTSYVTQSETFMYTVFIPPYRPGLFVTDRLFLVSLSRHRVIARCPPLDISFFFPKKFIWYSLMKGVCVGEWSKPNQRKKDVGFVRYRNVLFVKLRWDYEKLNLCVRSGFYDNILRLCDYDEKMQVNSLLWKRRNPDLIKYLVNFYEAKSGIPSVENPQYKWILLYDPPTDFTFKKEGAGDSLQHDLSWKKKGGLKVRV